VCALNIYLDGLQADCGLETRKQILDEIAMQLRQFASWVCKPASSVVVKMPEVLLATASFKHNTGAVNMLACASNT
jgi:hypothetical protein